MSSSIDVTKPANNSLLISQEIRTLATAAKAEIEALQAQIGNGVGQGVSYYLTSTTSDTGTYDVMSRSPDNTSEAVESVVVNASTGTIDVYIAEALGRTDIPAGEWSYDFFLYATPSTGVTYVTLELYKRATGGAETLLFSVNSPELNNAIVANYNIKTVQQAFSVLTTDRLVLKVTATTSHNNDVTVSLVHSGTDHYSHIVTPLAVETSQSIGNLIAGSSAKTTPVGADTFAISDSEDGGKLKKFSFTNLNAYFATVAPVKSVNTLTGDVILTTNNIADSSNKRYVTDANLILLGNTSGTNSGDNAVNSLYSSLVTNATHTGDVIGATVLTIAPINLPTTSKVFDWDFRNGKQLPAVIDFSRNSNVATHFNETGLLVLDSANVPRFNHVAGVCRGLLIEPSSTNLALRSEEFDTAAWTKTRSSVTANAAASPNGFIVADKLVEDSTASNTHRISTASGIGIESGKTYTHSVFAKKGERTWLWVDLHFQASGSAFNGVQPYAYFNLDSGAVGTFANCVARISAILDGWYLCEIYATATTTTTNNPGCRIATAGGVSYTGDGTSGLYMFGVNISDRQTSYIPTTSASVTRALDLATVSTTNFATLYRQDAYSVFCEFYGQAVGTCTIFDLHDGTANNRIYLESVSGVLTFNIVTGGVAQCAIALGSVVTDTLYKVAATWALNDVAASINGATVVTDTDATMPTLTQASVGCNYAGANQMNAELARLVGYATRLPNIELQGLST